MHSSPDLTIEAAAARAAPNLGLLRMAPVAAALLAGTFVALGVLAWLPEPPKQGQLAVAAISERTEVLALGASHVYTGVDPTRIERPWVNLSAGLLNYVFMEAILAAHAPRLTNLRCVVLDFDALPSFVDSYASSRGDYEHLLDLSPDLSVLEDSWSRKLALAKDRLLMYDLPFRRAFSRHKLNTQSVRDALRGPPPGPAQEAEVVAGHERLNGVRPGGLAGVQRAQAHFQSAYDADYSLRNLAAFSRIVARVKALGVPLILVRFPVHRSYREGSPKEFEQAYQRLVQTARAASPDAPLPLIDLTQEPAFSDGEFYDGDHLNRLGAARLTPVLASRVEAILRGANEPAAEL